MNMKQMKEKHLNAKTNLAGIYKTTNVCLKRFYEFIINENPKEQYC